MTNHIPKFQEEYSAKLPALALLAHLRCSFLPPALALSAQSIIALYLKVSH